MRIYDHGVATWREPYINPTIWGYMKKVIDESYYHDSFYILPLISYHFIFQICKSSQNVKVYFLTLLNKFQKISMN